MRDMLRMSKCLSGFQSRYVEGTSYHADDDNDEKNLAFCCALVFKYKAFFKRTTCNIVILGPQGINQEKEKGRGKR